MPYSCMLNFGVKFVIFEYSLAPHLGQKIYTILGSADFLDDTDKIAQTTFNPGSTTAKSKNYSYCL